MKHRPGNLFWILVLVLALAGWLIALRPAQPDAAATKALAETRQSLREQGFKTDLADFNLSTSPELRAREAVLRNTASNRFSGSFPDHPNLLPPVGNDSAMVVWKQDSLKRENRSSYDDSDQLSWDEFRAAVNQNQSLYDPACQAILSGPIRFNLDASHGSAMLLPHLAVMKNLAQTFGDRTALALHDGNPSAAWTNLLAATRLVTAYEPEPADVSHLVHIACAVLTYNTLWQALQTNVWTDDQLARLQLEWESVDYFTNLPTTVAFQRASNVQAREFEGRRSFRDDYTFSEFCKMAFHYPMSLWAELKDNAKHQDYRQHGSYEDQQALLLFYRDREVELRNALRATTWAQMRQFPGVTNEVEFQSKYRSPAQARLNMQRISRRIQQQGSVFLGRTAEAEALRRIIITALALERYRGKHGVYPNSLAALTPEFLQTPLPDFMDGQPLRYRLAADGHFLLYSVGLDGVDNGGKMCWWWRKTGMERPTRPREPQPEFDLVWPLPASDDAVQAMLLAEQKARSRQMDEFENQSAAAQWSHTSHHQANVAALLAAPATTNVPDINFHGQTLSEQLRNPKSAGTNKLSLCEMLTLRQIITGGEPENVTFELPIAYDVLTNLGSLCLMLDTNNDDFDGGSRAQQAQCERNVTNGNCLLTWSTIYETAGLHALQTGLTVNDLPPDKQDFYGPLLPHVITNLCQFSLDSATYDVETGARFHARLPEKNGSFSIECLTTNGAHLKTLTGSTTNGEFNIVWDLKADDGHRLAGETFHSTVQITLPNSGRTQTLRGP